MTDYHLRIMHICAAPLCYMCVEFSSVPPSLLSDWCIVAALMSRLDARPNALPRPLGFGSSFADR